MEQLLRWASFAALDVDRVAKFGLPIKAEPFYKDEDVLWGITISIIRDGEAATELGIRFDNEENEKHEWVGRGADGFPTLEGKKVSVEGKHLEIRSARTRDAHEMSSPTSSLSCTPMCMHVVLPQRVVKRMSSVSTGSWMTGPSTRRRAHASGTSARTWWQPSTSTTRLALPLRTRPPDCR
jgi:hypothetical protein